MTLSDGCPIDRSVESESGELLAESAVPNGDHSILVHHHIFLPIVLVKLNEENFAAVRSIDDFGVVFLGSSLYLQLSVDVSSNNATLVLDIELGNVGNAEAPAPIMMQIGHSQYD